jgi:hypothetical protein
VTASEVATFFSSAWQAATVHPLAGSGDVLEVPPAGPPRLEFYIQNRRPENSGGQRTVRTLDMVDLSSVRAHPQSADHRLGGGRDRAARTERGRNQCARATGHDPDG